MINPKKFFGIVFIVIFSSAILIVMTYPPETRYKTIEMIRGEIENGTTNIFVGRSVISDFIAYAQDTSLRFSVENIGEVKITADRSVYNMKAGVIELIGNIKFRSDKIYAELDSAKIYLKDDKIERIFGKGNVIIVTGGKEAKSKEIEIFPKRKEIILKGEPEVVQKNVRVKGEVIKINLDSDNIEVNETEAEIKNK